MNRFKKLIKTLKEAPTNSMGGVYSLNDPGFRVGAPDAQEKIYPDIDGNFTDGIPGNPGDPFYLRPEGYWNGGNNWTETEIPDASQEYLIEDPTGKSTSDLIAEDGTVKTAMPPDSRSFILGPLVDGYVYNHGYDNYSNIGYIQKDTRQFVLLARIQGQFIEGLHPQGGRVWDGTADQLTIYNSNFTLAMAEWFRDQLTAGTFTNNVPYFYSGGVPQQPQTPAECPNCPPNMFGGVTPGTNGGFGRGTNPTLGTQQGSSTSGNQVQANIFNLTPDQQRTVMNAVMLGLDIAAVVALLFPEPGSSAAGAAHLATKFRYVAKLRRMRGALNPFGQRAVRSGAAGRVRRQVYSGRPYQGKRGFGKTTYGTTDRATARTYSNPGPLKGTPGTGSRVNPRGTVDTGTLPQRYIDKYGSRSVLGQKQVKLGPKAAKRTFGEENEYILEQINKFMMFETAATGSDFGGGTEIADTYVDKVSETSSPEELEKASNDANDIAKESGQGLSDADLAKIDQDAAAEARRVTNIRISDPESMDGDQLFDAVSLMYDADEEITDQLMDQYESLLDIVALDKAYKNFREREEYLSSTEYNRSVSSEYARQYDISKNLWDNYFSRGFDHRYAVFTRDNVPYWWNGRTPEEGQTFTVSSLVWDDTGKEFSSSEYQKVRQWSAAGKRRDDLYLSEVYPEKKRQRDLNRAEYKTLSNSIFRPYIIAMIRGWNEMYGGDDNINDDPYSLKDLFNTDEFGLGKMSEAEKKKLLKFLQKSGLSYGEVAALPLVAIPLLANPAVQAAIAAGAVALTYELQKRGVGQSVVNAIVDTVMPDARELDPDGSIGVQDDFEDSIDKPLPDQTPAEQLADKHAKENASADEKLQDAMDQYGAGSDEERAARQERNNIRTRQRQERKDLKNKKESYEPRFLKNRERKNLTETRTPKQKKILREIKQPIKVKEAPTKYKMNFEGKYSAQNTPDKTASAQSDALVASGNAKGQKWKQQDKYWSGYETTERMNIIHDRVGHGKQAWDMILDEAKEKNGWRTREMQEELNKIAHERAMLKENPDYTSPFGNVEVSTTEKNLQNFEKVNKIKKVVSDKKVFSNKEIKPEYPEDDNKDREGRAMRMIQQMDQQKEYAGSKAQTGENAAARYKRLDPISANSMPDAGYPQIDQLRDQARKKPK